MYVAGKLLDGHTLDFEAGKKNWEKSCIVGDRLMQKGWSPYIPHHSLFMHDYIKETQHRDIPWEQWMMLDSSFMLAARALFFISHSKGADRELQMALDTGMQIYTSIDQVPNVIADTQLLDLEMTENVKQY